MIVVFTKSYPVRHIGHLDLMRTMQRVLRRSGVPVRHSHGFNPHMQLSFAAPLSVGIVGEHEIMDVSMESDCGESEFVAALSKATPVCLPIVSAKAVEDQYPTLMGLVAGSRYRIETDTDPSGFAGAIGQLLAMEEYIALRKTKSGENMSNIIPYIEKLAVRNGAIYFTARSLQSGSLKPKAVMNTLFTLADLPPCDYTVFREAILAKDAQGHLVPLEVLNDE